MIALKTAAAVGLGLGAAYYLGSALLMPDAMPSGPAVRPKTNLPISSTQPITPAARKDARGARTQAGFVSSVRVGR